MIAEQTKTLVWDLDGTLIDSFGIFSEILAGILPAHNYEMPAEQTLLENYHGSLEETVNNILGGVREQELASIIEDFLRIQVGHYEVIDHHIFPDALELAQRAHQAGLFQVLVTNRNHTGRLNASPRSIVERSALNGLIDIIIAGDDSEHRKPKPSVVETLLANGQLVPAETLVIGDQFVDAEFARNLGARAILVNRGGQQIAHMDRLGDEWNTYGRTVNSLSEVEL